MKAPPVVSGEMKGVDGTASSMNTMGSSGPNDAPRPAPDGPLFVKTSSPSKARSQPLSVFGSAGVTIAGGAASFTYTREAETGTWSCSELANVSPSAPASALVLLVDFDAA